MGVGRDWSEGISRDRPLLLAAPFALVIGLGLVLATSGLFLLDAARTAVAEAAGASMARQGAVHALEHYARTRDPARWAAYEEQIEVPVAYGRLASSTGDRVGGDDTAETALAGRAAPDGAPGTARLFTWGGWMSPVRESDRARRELAADVRRLDASARGLHALLESGHVDPRRVDALLEEIARTEARLEALGARFTAQLEAAARRLLAGIVAVAWTAAALLLVIGVVTSRRVVRAITRRQEVFRSMIERGHDIITILDAEGLILYESPALVRLLGYLPEEAEGRSCLARVHRDDLEVARRALALASRQPASLEFRVQARDGGWRTLESNAAPFPLAAGSPGIVVNSRDISERRQLEARLTEAERMESIGRLAGGVAHDFNNLITMIAGTASLLRDAPDLSPGSHEDLGVIEDACRRAAELTGRLLTFARRDVLEPGTVDLSQALGDLEPMLRRLSDDSVSLVLDLANEPLAIRADRTQLDRLIVNLVVNAAEALPDGGGITISTRPVELTGADETHPAMPAGGPGSYVRIEVSDTGEPIEEEVRAHAFEPFFTTKPSGSGLGLSTCYGIVAQNGGSIHAEGHPGKGTTFSILWPRVDTLARHASRAAAAASSAGSETILVVEDEPALRRTVVRILKRAGYDVLTAADGLAALECAASATRLDLLLTDVSMPRMNGRELAEALRRSRPALPVVFMSGYTEDASVIEQLDAREAHFVQKPFEPTLLARRLRRILDEAAAELPA